MKSKIINTINQNYILNRICFYISSLLAFLSTLILHLVLLPYYVFKLFQAVLSLGILIIGFGLILSLLFIWIL